MNAAEATRTPKPATAALIVPAVPLPRHLAGFTYRVPDALGTQIHEGDIVHVPFRNRIIEGVVWSLRPPVRPAPTRSVVEVTGRVSEPVRHFIRELATAFLASPAAFVHLKNLRVSLPDRRVGGRTFLAYLGAPGSDSAAIRTLSKGDSAMVVASGTTAQVIAGQGGFRLASDAAVQNLAVPSSAIVVYREEAPEHRRRTPPYFDVRRAAELRAQLTGTPLVLTARCPRAETVAAMLDGTVQRLGPPPPLTPLSILRASSVTDSVVMDAMTHNAAAGFSTFIWVAARDFAGSLVCTRCGWVARCDRCGVAQRVQSDRRLVCGSCATEVLLPRVCPRCGAADLSPRALGTAGVLRRIAARLPHLPVALLTAADPIPPPAFRGILIGTHAYIDQLPMYQTRGAVVLGVERFLAQPDFRAEERFAQRLTAIRFALPTNGSLALVGVDTHMLDGWTGDPRDKIESLLPDRAAFLYPPSVRLILLTGRRAPASARRFTSRSGVRRVDVLPGRVPRALLRVDPDAWRDLAPDLVDLPASVNVEPDPDGFGV